MMTQIRYKTTHTVWVARKQNSMRCIGKYRIEYQSLSSLCLCLQVEFIEDYRACPICAKPNDENETCEPDLLKIETDKDCVMCLELLNNVLGDEMESTASVHFLGHLFLLPILIFIFT